MDRRMCAGAASIVILVVLVLAIGVDADNIYACWGGCYNKCHLTSGKNDIITAKLCDYQCLRSCIPHDANDLKFFCQIGCSVKKCISVSIAGATKESCFTWCGKLCKKE